MGEISDLLARDEREDSEMPAKRVRVRQRCRRYSKIRHNSCTCKVEVEDADNSKASK